MIISCTSCNKKFEINSDLIPDSGRYLICSNCNNKWFFKKEKSDVKENIEINEIESLSKIENSEELKVKEIKQDTVKKIVKVKLEEKVDPKVSDYVEKIKKKNQEKKTSINILNLIIIFITSSEALVVLVDTFKTPISIVIPNIEIILYNLYETLKDIILFFKDLIK